jgi:hypothetical protein
MSTNPSTAVLSPLPLAVFLGTCLLTGAAAAAPAGTACSFQDALAFNTTVALATADAVTVLTIEVPQLSTPAEILKLVSRVDAAYRKRMEDAATQLPIPCVRELLDAVVSEDHADDHCLQLMGPFVEAHTNQIAGIATAYSQTSDRAAYEAGMRAVVADALRSLPYVCWFARPQAARAAGQTEPCPLVWSSYRDCQDRAKKAIVNGMGSALGYSRDLAPLCFRPQCPE